MASFYLKELVGADILQEMRVGRENLYINSAMSDLMWDRGPAHWRMVQSGAAKSEFPSTLVRNVAG